MLIRLLLKVTSHTFKDNEITYTKLYVIFYFRICNVDTFLNNITSYLSAIYNRFFILASFCQSGTSF